MTTFVQFGAADDAATGVPIAAGTAPTKLLREELGSAIQEAITLIASDGAQHTFTWIEVTIAP